MKQKKGMRLAAVLTALAMMIVVLAGCSIDNGNTESGATDKPASSTGDVGTKTDTPEATPEATEAPKATGVGYYKIYSVSEAGQEFSGDSLALLGLDDWFVVLEDGGKGFMYTMFEYEITWDAEKITEAESGEPVNYTLDGDTLSIVTGESGVGMVFKKSGDPAPQRGEHEGAPVDPGSDVQLKRVDEITFDGTTVVDNEQFLIRIDHIVTNDDNFLYGLALTLENRSADTKMIFSLEHAVVNGVEVSAMLYSELEPGKTDAPSISLYIDPLLEAGGDDPTKIELQFCVSNASDLWADPLYKEYSVIYPLGSDKAADFVFTPGTSDIIIKETDEFCIVARTLDKLDTWKTAMLDTYFVNKTDVELSFSFDEFKSGGVDTNPYFYLNLAPHAGTFTEISWSIEGVEESDYGKLDFTLIVRDRADYSNPIFKEKVSCDVGGLGLANPA